MTVTEAEHIQRRAADAFVAAGERWTPLRSKLFRLIMQFDRPVSAYNLGKALSVTEGRQIAITSIYRILALFVAGGIVRRIESLNAYLVSADISLREGLVFLICNQCGKVSEIEHHELYREALDAIRQVNFLPTRLVAEVRGLCESCRAGRPPLH
jgi:Fur family zinc uptake transcriptional regulator